MEAPQPSAPQTPRSVPTLQAAEQLHGSAQAQLARWQALLDEMRELSTQLEYVRLMLKLGVRKT